MKPDEILLHYSFEPRDDVTLEAITHNLQLHCPGNYQVLWEKKSNGVELIFDNQAEKTFWMLKWL